MIIAKPDASDILCGSVTGAGTIVTIPAGRVYTCDITISATQSIAGTSKAVVTFTPKGANCGPATTTAVAHCIVMALATSVTTNQTHITAVFHGGDSGADLSLATGGASAVSCAITGFLL